MSTMTRRVIASVGFWTALSRAGDGFRGRVIEAYREMAGSDPDRLVVVDGNGSVEEVADRVAAVVVDRLAGT
jgi:thymidylate kinase